MSELRIKREEDAKNQEKARLMQNSYELKNAIDVKTKMAQDEKDRVLKEGMAE